jgi:hypothetical protein
VPQFIDFRRTKRTSEHRAVRATAAYPLGPPQWAIQDSNLRPLPYQTALSQRENCPKPHVYGRFAPLTGCAGRPLCAWIGVDTPRLRQGCHLPTGRLHAHQRRAVTTALALMRRAGCRDTGSLSTCARR